MSHDELMALLEILGGVVNSQNYYKSAYTLIDKVKLANGSNFQYYTQDGLGLLRLRIETLPLSKSTPNTEGGVQEPIMLSTALDRIIEDFSVMSGLSISQWREMVSYLFDSHFRVNPLDEVESDELKQKSVRGANSKSIQRDQAIDMMLVQPWSIALLLMELLPIVAPR